MHQPCFHRDQGFSSVSEAIGADHRGAEESSLPQSLRPDRGRVTADGGSSAVPVAVAASSSG